MRKPMCPCVLVVHDFTAEGMGEQEAANEQKYVDGVQQNGWKYYGYQCESGLSPCFQVVENDVRQFIIYRRKEWECMTVDHYKVECNSQAI